MKMYGGSGDIAPPFLILTLDRGEWSASRAGRFNPGKGSDNIDLYYEYNVSQALFYENACYFVTSQMFQKIPGYR
jgi:hypothetical protein